MLTMIQGNGMLLNTGNKSRRILLLSSLLKVSSSFSDVRSLSAMFWILAFLSDFSMSSNILT